MAVDDLIDPEDYDADDAPDEGAADEDDFTDEVEDESGQDDTQEEPAGETAAEPEAAEAPPAPTAPQETRRFQPPPIGTAWTPDDHTRLVETLSQLDPESMATAVEGMFARFQQQVLQQAAALGAPDDPIEAAVRHNLAVMGANNPGVYSDPAARQVAEAVALQQVAAQTGGDYWQMMADHAAKRAGRAPTQPPAPPPATRPAPSTASRPVPPAQRTPTPTTAAQPPRTSQSRNRAAEALARDLGGKPEDYDMDGISRSSERVTVRLRR